MYCFMSSYLQSELTVTPVTDGYREADNLYFDHFRILGQMTPPTRVLVNAKEIFEEDYTYDSNTKVSEIISYGL